MSGGAIPISWVDMLLASSFIFVSAAISLFTGLGLHRSLLWAALRGILQLTMLGFALRWIFSISSPLIVLGFIALMLVFANHTMLSRVRRPPKGLYFRGLAALAVPGVTVTFAVTTMVIGVDPATDPRYLLPLAGMVIGNSMSAMSVVLDRLYSDLRANSGRIATLLALGAKPREAVWREAQQALRAGMIPTLNSMSAAGLVFIPGMMSVQILSCTDPSIAARYQVVILLMISAATAMGSVLAIYIGYRRSFSASDVFTLDR